jgi:outer membrane protein TolC
MAGIRFFPPNPWTVSRNATACEANIKALQYNGKYAKHLVAIEIRRLAAESDYFDKDLKMMDQLVALLQGTLDATQKGEDRGQTTSKDVTQAARFYLDAVSSRNTVRIRCEKVKVQLSGLIGIPADNFIIKIDTNDFETTVPIHMEKIAARDRPDLASLRYKSISAFENYRAAKSENYPWIRHIQFSYAEATKKSLPVPENDLSEEWRIDLAVNIPLFSWQNHASDVRKKEYQQAMTAESNTAAKADVEFHNSVSMMQNAYERKNKFIKETESVIKETERILRDSDDSALLPIDKARIMQQLIETRRAKLLSERDYIMSIINLQEVIGPTQPLVK